MIQLCTKKGPGSFHYLVPVMRMERFLVLIAIYGG